MTSLTNIAPDRFLDVKKERLAYRRLGPDKGTPLVFLQRFRGTMDDWDPALIDALAQSRPIVLFDSVGIGRSSGQVPATVAGMADAAADFLAALGGGPVDILGWSLGGSVAQMLTLAHPDTVHRLVVAGSSPGYVEGAPAVPDKVWQVAGKPINEDGDFFYLFFPETESGVQAGRTHLARLRERKDAFSAPVSIEAMRAQAAAIAAYGAPDASLLPALAELDHPALVANGYEDVMVPAFKSYAMASQMRRAKLILYPASGHGFLFQWATEFARDVAAFLDN